MPTAKKLYTFNETIVKTGLAIVTSEEEMNEAIKILSSMPEYLEQD